jgi:predicted membrane channel-forming protein YqfA (hemolysin III family)
VNSLQAPVILAVLAVALIVAGVALLAGTAWALIAAGVFTLVAAVVLYDPDLDKKQRAAAGRWNRKAA